MANWKIHIITGFLFASVFYLAIHHYNIASLNYILLSIPIIMYYSLLPDIDHQSSKITRIMLSISTAFVFLGFLGLKLKFIDDGLLIFGIIMLILTVIASSKLVTHRGAFHSFWFALLSPLLLLLLFPFSSFYLMLYLVAALSYWSHLVIDGEPFNFKITGIGKLSFVIASATAILLTLYIGIM